LAIVGRIVCMIPVRIHVIVLHSRFVPSHIELGRIRRCSSHEFTGDIFLSTPPTRLLVGALQLRCSTRFAGLRHSCRVHWYPLSLSALAIGLHIMTCSMSLHQITTEARISAIDLTNGSTYVPQKCDIFTTDITWSINNTAKCISNDDPPTTLTWETLQDHCCVSLDTVRKDNSRSCKTLRAYGANIRLLLRM